MCVCAGRTEPGWAGAESSKPRTGDQDGDRGFEDSAPATQEGAGEAEKATRPAGRFRAVFLNYLLDCLPAAVLEFDGDAVRQLYVRTCVARNVRLADYTDLTPQQLRERATRAVPPH